MGEAPSVDSDCVNRGVWAKTTPIATSHHEAAARLSLTSSQSMPPAAEISTISASAGSNTRTIDPTLNRRSCTSAGASTPAAPAAAVRSYVQVGAPACAGRGAASASAPAAARTGWWRRDRPRRDAPGRSRRPRSSPASSAVVTERLGLVGPSLRLGGCDRRASEADDDDRSVGRDQRAGCRAARGRSVRRAAARATSHSACDLLVVEAGLRHVVQQGAVARSGPAARRRRRSLPQ